MLIERWTRFSPLSLCTRAQVRVIACVSCEEETRTHGSFSSSLSLSQSEIHNFTSACKNTVWWCREAAVYRYELASHPGWQRTLFVSHLSCRGARLFFELLNLGEQLFLAGVCKSVLDAGCCSSESACTEYRVGIGAYPHVHVLTQHECTRWRGQIERQERNTGSYSTVGRQAARQVSNASEIYTEMQTPTVRSGNGDPNILYEKQSRRYFFINWNIQLKIDKVS